MENEIKSVSLKVTIKMTDGSLLKRTPGLDEIMNLEFDTKKCDSFKSDRVIYDNVVVEVIHHASVMFDRLAAKYNPSVAYSDSQDLIESITIKLNYQATDVDGKINNFEEVVKEIRDKKSNVSSIMTYTVVCNKLMHEMKNAIEAVKKKVV